MKNLRAYEMASTCTRASKRVLVRIRLRASKSTSTSASKRAVVLVRVRIRASKSTSTNASKRAGLWWPNGNQAVNGSPWQSS